MTPSQPRHEASLLEPPHMPHGSRTLLPNATSLWKQMLGLMKGQEGQRGDGRGV